MKLPYFRWYPTDFETDENVKLMSIYEIGLFTICLNHAWVNDGLPAEEEDLIRLLRVPVAQFKKAWPRVSPCFYEQSGRLRNPRQEKEREHATTKSNTASRVAVGIHPDKPGFIYLIRRPSDGQIKIGSSGKPAVRLAQLRNRFREDLKLVASWPVERMATAEKNLHQRFAEKRGNGEWFTLSGTEIAAITLQGDTGGDTGGDIGDHPHLRASASVSECDFGDSSERGAGENPHRQPFVPPKTRNITDLSADGPAEFCEFWGRYPQQVDRDKAARVWIGQLQAAEFPALFACLERWEQSDEWARGVVKRPEKWLLDGHRNGWSDRPAPKIERQRKLL